MLDILIVCLTNCLIGAVLVWMGLLIWKKQRIDLIHSYHYGDVKVEDYPVYTAEMGKQLTTLGACLIVVGIFNYLLQTQWGWLIFLTVSAYILVQFWKIQRQYNGRLFSFEEKAPKKKPSKKAAKKASKAEVQPEDNQEEDESEAE